MKIPFTKTPVVFGEGVKLNFEHIKSVMEGLLFVAGDEGIEAKELADVLEIDTDTVIDLIHDMQADFKRQKRGLQIVEVAQAFQLTTLPEHAPYFEKLAYSPTYSTLSQASLETLAIIAYRQPITRAEIEEIRGVKSDRAITNLTNKQLIQEIGRAEGPGRPILYGTSREFLEYFGLKSINDLPPVPELDPDQDIENEAELLFSKLNEAGQSEPPQEDNEETEETLK
ncbi:MAG: SMC-Scp complex subunit ScpB [Bacillaceae bacterium]|nr:SMC-Scp complex subunit ScpB [Bacillaceae bacterium]